MPREGGTQPPWRISMSGGCARGVRVCTRVAGGRRRRPLDRPASRPCGPRPFGFTGRAVATHGAPATRRSKDPETAKENPAGAECCSGGVFKKSGGAKGDRTPDLLNAIQALSQLSYGPRCSPQADPWALPRGAVVPRASGRSSPASPAVSAVYAARGGVARGKARPSRPGPAEPAPHARRLRGGAVQAWPPRPAGAEARAQASSSSPPLRSGVMSPRSSSSSSSSASSRS